MENNVEAERRLSVWASRQTCRYGHPCTAQWYAYWWIAECRQCHPPRQVAKIQSIFGEADYLHATGERIHEPGCPALSPANYSADLRTLILPCSCWVAEGA